MPSTDGGPLAVEPSPGGDRFETLAVHAGASGPAVDEAHPTATPIVTASSYWYTSAEQLDAVLGGDQPGYVYGRFASPTVAAFEQAVAALEAAPGAVAFASGMAAIEATLAVCTRRPGDLVLASQDCYGGTYTLLTSVLAARGTRTRFVDVFDLEALAHHLRAEQPRALLLETITNPLVRVVDLPAVTEVAGTFGVPTIVDSTFTTPRLQRPITLGATYALHSATKYLGGHGDVTAGVVACATAEHAAALHTYARLAGAVLGPHEAYLALRGVRTLALRVERQCANALALARALIEHPRVERVYYPGLPADPSHAVATRQFGGLYGGVLAFQVRDARKLDMLRLMDRLRLIRPAPTLGDVCSLALYPAIASHRGLTPEQRAARGIHDNVLRLSAGIEAAEDLVEDLRQALASL